MKLSLRVGISAAVSTALVAMMTRSIVIALAFGALTAGIACVVTVDKTHINEAALIAAWLKLLII